MRKNQDCIQISISKIMYETPKNFRSLKTVIIWIIFGMEQSDNIYVHFQQSFDQIFLIILHFKTGKLFCNKIQQFYITMTTHQDQFFATQISYDHSRPYTTGKIRQQANSTTNPYIKMKMIKTQLKKANQQYRQALRSNQKTRNSVDKANKDTQLTRVNFLKVYETKRMKMFEKQLMEDLKERLRQCNNKSAERAHRIRNQGQIQSRLIKHEQQQYLQQLRIKNKKEKEQIRIEKQRNKKLLFDNAKKQYQQIKNAQTQLLVRRRKIQSMLQARAKQNYMTKLSKQMQLLNSYNMLAKQLNEIENEQPQQQIRITSKSFFITKQ